MNWYRLKIRGRLSDIVHTLDMPAHTAEDALTSFRIDNSGVGLSTLAVVASIDSIDLPKMQYVAPKHHMVADEAIHKTNVKLFQKTGERRE